MFDPIFTAEGVAGWTALGVKLPKALAKSLDIFEAVRRTQVDYQPVFELSKVTADNAEAMLREFATQLLPALPLVDVIGGRGQSVLSAAKARAVELAARAVLQEAGAAVEEVINQLSPTFAEHAGAYAEAVAKLPADVDDRALVNAGPEAVAAFAVAQGHAGYLSAVSTWVANTRNLPGHALQPDAVTRILRPETAEQLAKLDAAQRKPANSTLAAIDPVLFVAAREAVVFGINSLREAADIRRAIEAHEIEPKPLQVA